MLRSYGQLKLKKNVPPVLASSSYDNAKVRSPAPSGLVDGPISESSSALDTPNLSQASQSQQCRETRSSKRRKSDSTEYIVRSVNARKFVPPSEHGKLPLRVSFHCFCRLFQ